MTDFYDYEADEDWCEAEEWVEGQCDNCPGYVAGAGVGITPVCACAIGQGAGPEDCVCGPQDGDGDG